MKAKPKLVLTARWPEAVVEALHADYDLIVPGPDERLTGDVLSEALAGGDKTADAIGVIFFDAVNDDFMAALPDSVRIIVSYGVGTDHIDLKAAARRRLVVTNTPDVLTDETADLAIGLMIATARGFYERESALRNGRWHGAKAADALGVRVSGKTLGIIGMGRIGQATAKRAKAFDMEIIYASRTRKPGAEAELGAKWRDNVDDVMREADFISLHTDLSPETHHIIDARRIGLMKSSAFIINTGRGALIDEVALVEALQKNRIAGAGLDVYEYEPKLTTGLTELNNVTLLPHIGSATTETRDAMGFRAKENLDAWFATGAPRDRVV